MKEIFGFLTFDGVEELDLAGPWEMVGIWREALKGPEPITVGPRSSLIHGSKGLGIQVEKNYADCPPLNYLLIPGGQGSRTLCNDPSTIEFIKKQNQNCKYILTVCTGFLILYNTGLIKGKKMTTYHLLPNHFPDVEIVSERYHQDGRFWSSAGVSAGVDMILAFIAHLHGEKAAGKIQFLAEYYPLQKVYSIDQPLPLYAHRE